MQEDKRNPRRFNTAFHKLRVSRDWSQEKMGAVLGYTRQYIAQVENGVCSGKIEFWNDVQTTFNIPDSKMWELINGTSDKLTSPPIHFLCDQKQCKNCKSDICSHTINPKYAKNFEFDGYAGYWEKR